MFPDDSIQYMVNDWWIEDNTSNYCRGRLIKAFLPHIDQIPKKITAIARSEPTVHDNAIFIIEPLRINQPQRRPFLPVAALPAFENEINAVYRSKKRPAVIICDGGEIVDKKFTLGKPKWQTSPTILVAPYYGVDEGSKRAGFNHEFITLVRRCSYPQFIWDKLPIGSIESLMRLDHIQPIGKHHDSIEITNYRLSEDAVHILDEWLRWLINGYLEKESLLFFFKKEINEIEKMFVS